MNTPSSSCTGGFSTSVTAICVIFVVVAATATAATATATATAANDDDDDDYADEYHSCRPLLSFCCTTKSIFAISASSIDVLNSPLLTVS